MIVWPLPCEPRQQLNVEPIGNSAVIADDGVLDVFEQLVWLTAFGKKIIVRRVAREQHRALKALPFVVEPLSRYYQEITALHQLSFHRQQRRRDTRKILPFIHTIVNYTPAPTTLRFQRNTAPRSDHHVADYFIDVRGAPQIIKRFEREFHVFSFNDRAANFQRSARGKLYFIDIFSDLPDGEFWLRVR